MKKIILTIFAIILLGSASNINTYAEEVFEEPMLETNSEKKGITISPSRVIMQINDYGKTYTFKLNNNSGSTAYFLISEGLVTQDENGVTIPLNEEVEKSFLEVLTPEITVEDSEVAEIKIRSRIIGNDTTQKFPAIIIKSDAEEGSNVGINYEMYIPFIAQNTTGDLSMNTVTKIDADAFSFNPKLSIIGSVINDGDKFINPSGTIAIFKDGVKIYEKEITSQIRGLLMPGIAKGFSLEWTNENDDPISALGEYTVETRTTSDLSDKIYGSRINFFYIPIILVYILAGLITTIVITVIVVQVVKKRNLNINKQ